MDDGSSFICRCAKAKALHSTSCSRVYALVLGHVLSCTDEMDNLAN